MVQCTAEGECVIMKSLASQARLQVTARIQQPDIKMACASRSRLRIGANAAQAAEPVLNIAEAYRWHLMMSCPGAPGVFSRFLLAFACQHLLTVPWQYLEDRSLLARLSWHDDVSPGHCATCGHDLRLSRLVSSLAGA